jgi:hemerythrin
MADCALECDAEIFHKNEIKLFRILKNLENGMRANPSQAGLTFSAINALFDFSTHDMVREEEELDRSCHPDAQVHKKEHEYFKSSANYYFSMMQFGSLPQAMEVREFLSNWIIMHVSHSRAFERR